MSTKAHDLLHRKRQSDGCGESDGGADLVETLKQVDAPVAILCGSEDSCIGAEDGDRLSRALPEVKQIRFEGLGHGFGRPLDKGFLGRLAGIVRGSLE